MVWLFIAFGILIYFYEAWDAIKKFWLLWTNGRRDAIIILAGIMTVVLALSIGFSYLIHSLGVIR